MTSWDETVLSKSLTRSCYINPGPIPHLPHDHWCPTRWDLAWSSRPREIDHHPGLFPFSNNCTNCCCLLAKLLACCPVAHPSLVQVYNFICCPYTALWSWPLWRGWSLFDWVCGQVSFILVMGSNRCS